MIRLRFLVVFAVCFVGSWSFSAEPDSITRGLGGETRPGGADKPGKLATAEEEATTVGVLDLKTRVSQLMFVTLQGQFAPNTSDLKLLKEYPPGGVLIPGILSPGSAAEYVAMLRALPAEQGRGLPLFIGADLFNLIQQVHSQQQTFVQLPSLLSLAAAQDSGVTARFSDLLAEQLSTIGFNLHLGPSLELAPTIRGARGSIQCLGSDPVFVGETGALILKALDARGIIGVPLGFPGGGANRLPREAAVLTTPKPALEAQELAPFKVAIAANVAVIHVGSTLTPTLDPAMLPACLSKAVLQDVLRTQLGFKGVALAGPLDVLEIANRFDVSEAAIMALEAGADMLFWNQADQRVMNTVDAIMEAVKTGRLTEGQIDAAFMRAQDVKRRFDLKGRAIPLEKDAVKLTGKKSLAEEAYEVERRAITLVMNRDNTLPLSKEKSSPVGLTGTASLSDLQEFLQKHLKSVVRQPLVSAKHDGQVHSFELGRIAKRLGGAKTVICVFTSRDSVPNMQSVIRAVKENGGRVVVVMLGYPHSLGKLGQADAIVLAYSQAGGYAQTAKALADVLVGLGPIGIYDVDKDVQTAIGKSNTYSALDLIHVPAGKLPVTVEAPFEAGLVVPYNPLEAIKKAEWDFGDGKRAKGLQAEHAYAAAGRFPVTLTITDVNGELAVQQFFVQVE